MRECGLHETKITMKNPEITDICSLSYGGSNNVGKIYEYIYNVNSNIKPELYLDRKKVKMEIAFKKYKKNKINQKI